MCQVTLPRHSYPSWCVKLTHLRHGIIVSRELVEVDTVALDLLHDTSLEARQLHLGDRVGLGDDGDDVYLGL